MTGRAAVFGPLGRFVTRFWWLCLLGWVAGLVALRAAAPPWADVAQDREFSFLPAGSPSRLGEEAFRRAFPDDRLASNIVVVVHRPGSKGAHLAEDKRFVEDVIEPGLRNIAEAEGGLADEAPPSDGPLFPAGEADPARAAGSPPPRSVIARIRTPNAPGVGALLVSQDREALLVAAELTTEFLSGRNADTVAAVEDFVRGLRDGGRVPPGVELAVTGSAVIGRDHARAERDSVRATELWTGILVVGLLVLIYRAPLLALIPLVTVFVAVQAAVSLLAILAGAGYVTLFQGIQIYVTILSYGAGVDYSLFLTARYKEELDAGAAPPAAAAAAVAGVGSTVTASALTVIGGIAAMVFAEFGKFREAGVAVPLSLALVLLATLTLSPALLRLAGRWAFWPRSRPDAPPAPGPAGEGPCDALHPRPFHDVWCRAVRAVRCRSAAVWVTTAAVMAPFAVAGVVLHDRLSYDLIGNLPADAPSAAGTAALRRHFPEGITGQTSALLIDPRRDFRSPGGRDLVAAVTERLRADRAELGLADVRSLTAPLGVTPAGRAEAAGRREAVEEAAEERYLSDLGERTATAARFDLTLDADPFSRGAVDALGRVERAVRESLPPADRGGAVWFVVGPTASVRDLAAVMRRDRVRIEGLVLAVVFLILLVLLRQVVVPAYLLLSVLLSYFTTLGVTFALFWALDPAGFAGLDWKVAVFLFAILIAVGEDYNIFLIDRVREEQRERGPIGGVMEALVRTGPIISSCGVIMAGTFASLLAGSLTEMKQLGFALAFGVLLDTFVVRPVLVPTFLVILYRGQPGAPGDPTCDSPRGA